MDEGQNLPEIIPPPDHPSVSVWRWRVTPKTAVIVRVGAAISSLGVAGWLLQNFLQLRGVVSLLASRIDLGFLAFSVFLTGCALTIGVQHNGRWRAAIGIAVVIVAFGIDWLAPKPRSPEPEKAAVAAKQPDATPGPAPNVSPMLPLNKVPEVTPQAHARLEVIDVQMMNPPGGEPFVNVFYTNRGRLPSQGFLRSYAVRVTKDELDPPALLEIQTWNDRRASAKQLRDMAVDYHEMYPNDPPNFFSVPGHTGEESLLLSQNIGDVRAGGDTRIYIFTSMIFRDLHLAPNRYGVAEKCFYYWKSFDARHDCGSRYTEKSFNDLVEHAGGVVP